VLATIKRFFDAQLTVLDGADPDDSEHVLRLATTALLVEISRADTEVSLEEERAIVELVGRVFELDAAETQGLVRQADGKADEAVSLYGFTRVLNDHLSREQRTHVIELLWRVAYADGHIDKYEDYYIRKIADLLHVSHRDFIRTKHLVMES